MVFNCCCIVFTASPVEPILRTVDWHLYKDRHLVECFFQKSKWFRRIATRYYKSAASFLAFVYLASIAILLL